MTSLKPPKSSKILLNDCFLNDKERLRHADAIDLLRSRLIPIAETHEIALENSLGAILAKEILATRDTPSTDNSAVDGYAYNADDFEKTGGYFPVVTRIAAGNTDNIELPGFSAARIFTGAAMPDGADTIAMQEDCEIHDQDGAKFIAIPPGLKKGANRRKAGEDLKIGDIIAKAGERLTPQTIAAIASTGIAEVEVRKPLRIAILSSGDELLEPGETAIDGQVYDSNRYLLKTLLQNLPVEIIDLGIQPDNYDVIESKLAKAAEDYDIILSSGGASRGEEDHIITALETLGTRHLWQLAVKPGRPMSFGQIGNSVFFGLPGNPVACFVCYLLYVRPSLLRLSGADWETPKRYPLPALFNFQNKKPDRREFWRGIYTTKETGIGLIKFERDGSGLISGLREADGLIEIEDETTQVKKGDLLNFIPWSEFGL
ncbi:MAG: gephyrin-like molybdotransferase Glp [Salaquimonas sp.]